MTKINNGKIVQLRKQRNISQKELASAIAVSQQMISFVELGLRQGSIDILHKLSKYFNCTVDDLLIPPENEDTA